MKPTKRKLAARTGISLPEALMKKGRKRATELDRNFSEHIKALIRADLEAAEAQQPA